MILIMFYRTDERMGLSEKCKYNSFLPNHKVLDCSEGRVRFLRADIRASIVMSQSPYIESHNA